MMLVIWVFRGLVLHQLVTWAAVTELPLLATSLWLFDAKTRWHP